MRRIGWVVLVGVALLTAVGCRVVNDAQSGMAAHQQEIQAQTGQIVGSTVDLAFPAAHAPAMLAIGWILAWWFGRKDRLASKGKSEIPALGWLGAKVPVLEAFVQHAADVFHGTLNIVGSNGTPLNSAWKYFATGVIALLAGAAANPGVQAWVAHNGLATLAVTAAGSVITALHTGIDPIKPVDVGAPATPSSA